jgi:carbonic anhydrase
LLLVTGSQAFIEMTQDQQHRRQALLAIHHHKRIVIICPQDKRLKAVKLFWLGVLTLCELANVVQ